MRLLAALLFLVTAHTAAAAEPGEKPSSSGTPSADAAGAEPPDAGTEPDSTPAESQPSPDVFVPSEDISEDLSIAFPIDV